MAVVPDRSGNNPTDQKFNTVNRTGANAAAVLALTPLYPGEIALALDTGIRYRALSVSPIMWGQVVVEM